MAKEISSATISTLRDGQQLSSICHLIFLWWHCPWNNYTDWIYPSGRKHTWYACSPLVYCGYLIQHRHMNEDWQLFLVLLLWASSDFVLLLFSPLPAIWVVSSCFSGPRILSAHNGPQGTMSVSVIGARLNATLASFVPVCPPFDLWCGAFYLACLVILSLRGHMEWAPSLSLEWKEKSQVKQRPTNESSIPSTTWIIRVRLDSVIILLSHERLRQTAVNWLSSDNKNINKQADI